VPLSLVGTFGVMYLAGFSINNLTLMALTIATGFVVDDAIVMIENISRYIEAGRAAAASRAQGRRADRLHHHLAHVLADRGADPAAVHGRRRRAAVPRVRDHARGADPDLGRRLAHADADDVRALLRTRREPSRARSTARASAGSTRDRRYGRCSTGCSTARPRRCWSRSHAGADVLLYISCPRASSRCRTPA
jgi:hypothetical protein